MSITVTTQNVDDRLGSMRLRIADVLLDSSYPTGGYALAKSDFSLSDNSVTFIIPQAVAGYIPIYDGAKLLMYRSAGFTPAGTNSQNTYTVKAGTIMAGGGVGLVSDAATSAFVGGTAVTTDRALTTTSPVGTATFTGTAVAAGVLVEVSNGVSLSTVTVRCLCILAK